VVYGGSSGLEETNGGSLLAEALPAKVKAVLADETGLVRAEAALTAALAELAGAREPNGVVGHFGEVLGFLLHQKTRVACRWSSNSVLTLFCIVDTD